MKRMARNFFYLIGVALPLWMFGLWVAIRLSEGSSEGLNSPGAWGLYILILLPQLLVGGALHQALVSGFARVPSLRVNRGIVLLTSSVIPLVLMLLGGAAGLLLTTPNVVPLVIALA